MPIQYFRRVQKWVTKNPIPLRDSEFGVIRLRGFGSYSFRVCDIQKLLLQFVGTNSQFQIDNFEDQLKALVINEFTDALGELKIPALDLAANYKELGSKIEALLNTGFKDLGLEIQKFLIENISMPPEVEAAIDKRSQMNVIGNLDIKKPDVIIYHRRTSSNQMMLRNCLFHSPLRLDYSSATSHLPFIFRLYL